MTSYRFFKMAAGSHIGFDLDNIRCEVVLKFGLDRIYNFGDIAIFIFCRFGLILLIHAHFWGRGWGIFLLNDVTHRPNS